MGNFPFPTAHGHILLVSTCVDVALLYQVQLLRFRRQSGGVVVHALCSPFRPVFQMFAVMNNATGSQGLCARVGLFAGKFVEEELLW